MMGNAPGISYPTPRGGSQAGGFGQNNVQQPPTQSKSNTPSNRVFTGTVTKLHDNFGFVDDDVFFQANVCKGGAPRVGDRVLVEASYNANMPFKWNATRVTQLPTGGNDSGAGGQGNMNSMGSQGGGFGRGGGQQRGFGNQGGFGGGAQGGFGGGNHGGFGSGNQGGFGGGNQGGFGGNQGGFGMNQGGFGSGGNMGNDRSRDRDRPARNRSPIRRQENRREDRERSSRKRSRSKSNSKARSPPRRKAKNLPRYNVSVPKVSLTYPVTNVTELQKRYKSMYIPSDFFTARHVWNEAFPIHAPFNITFPSVFHVFNKDHVEPIAHNKFQYDPPDADYTYVAKVMLLASPGPEALYEKTCHLIEKDSDTKDGREGLVHPSRALKFLVGLKGKSETMAIGGPWSPSLDGADPKNDPSVLIKTAIRTCGAMTGLDLTNCTQWTRFNEIHYRRQATSSRPARTETVVIFFPDVWSCMPPKIDYDASCEIYASKAALKCEGKSVKLPDLDEIVDMDSSVNEEEEDGGEEVKKSDPTHWKELTPKNMKVNELKGELEARGQSSKGLKSQLQARLQKLLATEQEAEEKKSEEEKGDDADKEEKTEEEKEAEENKDPGLPSEKEQEKIKSYYKTPSSPCFFIHPNQQVKSGKFDCRVESLSVLLDYRSDDNKEGTFELSHFAELFNEMMMRDSAFKILKSISNAPEKPKEDPKKKEEEKKKKEEEKKKKEEEEKKMKEEQEKEEEELNEDEKREKAEKRKEEEAKKKEDEKKKRDEEKKKKEEEEEEKKKNTVTMNKDLLLACSYFDLSHIGYFEAKDLEDIFLSLELDLSRAEVKKLSHKLIVGSRDHVNYRALTDGDKRESEKDVVAPVTSDRELAAGFKQYVPGGAPDASTDAVAATMETNKLVKFRGSVLDIEKLMEKMDKSERTRLASESRQAALQKELKSVTDQSEKFHEQRDKLATELKANREKIKTLEQEIVLMKGDGAKYMNALKDVLLRIQPLFPPPKMEQPEEVKTEETPKENGVKENAAEKAEEPSSKNEKVEEAAAAMETETEAV